MASETSSQHSRTREPDADQLLKLLDIQLRHAQRDSTDIRRAAFRVWSLVGLILATIVSLLVMQFMLSDLRARNHSNALSSAVAR